MVKFIQVNSQRRQDHFVLWYEARGDVIILLLLTLLVVATTETACSQIRLWAERSTRIKATPILQTYTMESAGSRPYTSSICTQCK